MKSQKGLSIGLYSLLVLLAPMALYAGSPSTNGDFQFSVPGGTRTVQFNAQQDGSGAKGHLTFAGPAEIPDQDVDGDGTSSAGTVNVSFTVDVDCLKLTNNRASISGLVTSSNVESYLGRRIVLAVEDNGEGSKSDPDRYTWGSYVPSAGTWIPSDAELVFDNGASFSWLATDFERPDDVGFQYQTKVAVTTDCQSFPLVSYVFDEVPHGAGNIQVKP
jgi:hypothetical protein